jgi:hypothetical protein
VSGPRRHHYVAQHYLRRWSPDGKRVVVVRLPLGSGTFGAGVRDLAVEKNLYAIETPDGLDQVVEVKLTAPIDGAFSSAIEALLKGEQASASDIAVALGLQLVRGPEVKAHLNSIKTEVERAREKFTRLFRGEEVDEDALHRIVETAEQNEWVGMLVSSVLDMAEVLAQMRWHFVYFPEAMLVTSDSPISYWRRDELNRGPVGMAPMSVDEVRLPLAPTLALVMTWDEGEPLQVKGTRDMARELNIATCEFAQQRRIFVVPDPSPVFPDTQQDIAWRGPVVADLSVLPPLQQRRKQVGESIINDLKNIPGLEGIAADLMHALRP